MFVTQNQSAGWVHLQHMLPKDSMIFAYCSKEQLAEGMGFRSLAWDKEVIDHKNFNFTSTQDEEFMKSKGYGYAVIDYSCMFQHTEAEVNGKISQLFADGHFKARKDLSNSDMVVFEVS
jgi:Trm5-related predicted tRNA methylase